MTAPKLPELPETIWADPGRRNWYFRERKPDSVTSYIRADLHQSALADRDAKIARLQEELAAAQEAVTIRQDALEQRTAENERLQARLDVLETTLPFDEFCAAIDRMEAANGK